MEPDWSKPMSHTELQEFENKVRRFYALSSDTALKLVSHVRMLNEVIDFNVKHTIQEIDRLSAIHPNDSVKNALDTLKSRIVSDLKGIGRN
jgi:hypothetical protein